MLTKKFLKEMPVCGLQAVKAIAEYNPQKISRLFFSETTSKQFGKICKYLAENKKLYRLVSEDELEKLSGSVHHQGVTAMIYEPLIPRLDLERIDTWTKTNAGILMLDEVGNTNNLGAIIRSAAFFGIENIVITEEDKQAELTTSAYRIAQGGMEFVNIYKVSSTVWFLRQCRGRITSLGTDLLAHHNVSEINRFIKKDEPCIIVLGNEEHGINSETKKLCTHLMKISGAGTIESLNVAQAAAVFCNALKNL